MLYNNLCIFRLLIVWIFFRSRMKSNIKWRIYLWKGIRRYLPKLIYFLSNILHIILWFFLFISKCKNVKRMNERLNYTLHDYCYVYGILYSRLESKQVSKGLSHLKTKFQNKTKTKPCQVFATSCRDFSLANFCQAWDILCKTF